MQPVQSLKFSTDTPYQICRSRSTPAAAMAALQGLPILGKGTPDQETGNPVG
jgi:hypothetical protein